MKLDVKSTVRVVVFFLAWFNQYLGAKGKSPIPVDEEVITFLITAWMLYKNNYLFKKGLLQKEVLEKENLK